MTAILETRRKHSSSRRPFASLPRRCRRQGIAVFFRLYTITTNIMQRAVLLRTLRAATSSIIVSRPIFSTSTHPVIRQPSKRWASHASPSSIHAPTIGSSNKTAVEEKMEEITEIYATAQDEFEIAMEETEKMSVYAEEDRKAAREELTRVQEAYKAAVEGEDRDVAEEVKRRVGQRIRELEQGVNAMEELAINQD
ncbi:hypothetical protein LTR97_005120 [Elasticomyces elasticus]|uniref:Uncharacterized protein n=1 Tax=Elasticomyces elasticus TaxID=574655 RepID=A0AAN7WJP0_9PEZI|nr:hypothetical protein LTR97_005120 [Elasticomyces elasticus]